jgi:hypothetical protein
MAPSVEQVNEESDDEESEEAAAAADGEAAEFLERLDYSWKEDYVARPLSAPATTVAGLTTEE